MRREEKIKGRGERMRFRIAVARFKGRTSSEKFSATLACTLESYCSVTYEGYK
jgi:hypothetical protein